jgi:hypothetical protein
MRTPASVRYQTPRNPHYGEVSYAGGQILTPRLGEWGAWMRVLTTRRDHSCRCHLSLTTRSSAYRVRGWEGGSGGFAAGQSPVR